MATTKKTAETSVQDEFRSKYRSILVYETEDHGEIIFRPPTRPEYQRLMSQISDGKGDQGATIMAFVRACRAHPSAEKFERFLDDYPAIVSDAGIQLQEMALPGVKGIVKKGS